MAVQPAPDLVVAERFRLNRLIGRGGMGSVWLATHLGLDIPCAVKFIEGEGAVMPEMQARFEREAKAAAQLRSPHVVQILDHGVWGGTPYIAMELLDGEDLGKRLMRLGRMSAPEVLAIVTQVGRALTKAHARGVVHRDLKPDNIFLVRDDDREIAKVLDFGIAKASGPGTPGTSTRTGALLGTPYYMSPEQAQGTKAVDARSDLWSLAVIVFEALTGQRPFESEALGDLLMRIIVAPIPLPSEVLRDLPSGVDTWWAKASQRDPAQRFQSAKELCDGLAVALGRSAGDAAEPRPFVLAARPEATPAPLDALTPKPHAASSTGAPIAQTFMGKPPAKGRTAMVIALGGALAIVGAGVAGVSWVANGKADPAMGSALTATIGSVVSLPDARAVEPLEATSAVAATPIAPEPIASTPPPVGVAQAPATRPPAVAKALTPAARPPIAKPYVTPPVPPETKRKPVDLGI
jgi:serine/threonine-protein kinase